MTSRSLIQSAEASSSTSVGISFKPPVEVPLNLARKSEQAVSRLPSQYVAAEQEVGKRLTVLSEYISQIGAVVEEGEPSHACEQEKGLGRYYMFGSIVFPARTSAFA